MQVARNDTAAVRSTWTPMSTAAGAGTTAAGRTRRAAAGRRAAPRCARSAVGRGDQVST